MSVRTMLLVTAIIGIITGWIVLEGRLEVWRQREALRVIKSAHGIVFYSRRPNDGAGKPTSRQRLRGWIAGLFGDSRAEEVVSIKLANDRRSDFMLPHVGHLTDIVQLDLSQPVPFGIEAFFPGASADGRTSETFAPALLTDNGLIHLKRLKKLVRLNLSGTAITDGGLVYIEGFTKLEMLNLSDTQVGDAGLVHLAALTNLRYLNLNRTVVTDLGLARLKQLTRLRTLELSHTAVSDAGIAHLKGLASLRSVDFRFSRVTNFGAQELGRSLPNTKVMFSSLILR